MNDKKYIDLYLQVENLIVMLLKDKRIPTDVKAEILKWRKTI